MSKKSLYLVFGTFIIASAIGYLFLFKGEPKNEVAASDPIELNWIIAHEPIAVFERSANFFKERVEKKSDGRIKVNIMTFSDFDHSQTPDPEKMLQSLKEGKVQMSQVYTNMLVRLSPVYELIELPFLFNGHDHVSRVFDGKIGNQMLASLEPHNLKGLGFTYSGGFKLMVAKDPNLKKFSEFKKLTVRTYPGQVAKKFFREVSKEVVRDWRIHLKESLQQEMVDSGEATYSTIPWAPEKDSPIQTILETNHSVFLTTLLMNKDFYNNLPKDLQRAVSEAAREAAQIERKTSIEDGERVKREIVDAGRIQIRKLTESELEDWKKKAEPIYEDLKGTQTGQLVSQIRELK